MVQKSLQSHLPTRRSQGTVRTSVSLPTDVYVELEKIAQNKKVSLAWVIRDALEQYLTSNYPLFQDK